MFAPPPRAARHLLPLACALFLIAWTTPTTAAPPPDHGPGDIVHLQIGDLKFDIPAQFTAISKPNRASDRLKVSHFGFGFLLPDGTPLPPANTKGPMDPNKHLDILVFDIRPTAGDTGWIAPQEVLSNLLETSAVTRGGVIYQAKYGMLEIRPNMEVNRGFSYYFGSIFNDENQHHTLILKCFLDPEAPGIRRLCDGELRIAPLGLQMHIMFERRDVVDTIKTMKIIAAKLHNWRVKN